MKRMNCLALCTCLLAGSAFGQAQITPYTPSSSSPQRDRSSDSTRSKNFFRSKDLVGANVKDARGQKVGSISELYINPQTSTVMAIVDITGPRDAVVPLQELTVAPPPGAFRGLQVTLKTTKAELESGPTVSKNEMYKLDLASFNQQVYTHYNLQVPATALGGAEPPSGAITGGESSSEPKLIPHEDRPPR